MTKTDRVVLCEFLETGIEGVESISPFCTKVRWALALAEIPFTSRRTARPDAIKELNPACQLPVLLVDDLVVADSTAILTRIELLSPGAFDRSLDAEAIAEAWLWEEMADSVLNGFLVAARWADDANWPAVSKALFGNAPWPVQKIIVPKIRKRVQNALRARDVLRHGDQVMRQRFDETLDRLDSRAPTAGYWLGGGPSRADLAIAAQLHSLRPPLTPSQAAKLAKRPKLTAYLDRVVAATRANAVS